MLNIRKTMRTGQMSALLTLLISGQINASTLDKSAEIEQTIISDAQKSQSIVSGSSEHAFELKAEIDALKAEINNLKIYQNHLEKLVDSQIHELGSLDSQMEQIAETRQSIIPLMYEMLEGLTRHIGEDMPIRKEARLKRVENLRAMMAQANISDAEKYRRILEAFQIELDYTTKLSSYSDIIKINGAGRKAELLYLGHVSFIARSIDKQNYWVWNNKTGGWQALEAALNPELNKAFLVANKQASPSILALPLSLQETAQ